MTVGVKPVFGDWVPVVLLKELGKPSPAVVIQADLSGELASRVVLPVTSDFKEAPLLRITFEPSAKSDLEMRSQMIWKIQAVFLSVV